MNAERIVYKIYREIIIQRTEEVWSVYCMEYNKFCPCNLITFLKRLFEHLEISGMSYIHYNNSQQLNISPRVSHSTFTYIVYDTLCYNYL